MDRAIKWDDWKEEPIYDRNQIGTTKASFQKVSNKIVAKDYDAEDLGRKVDMTFNNHL